MKGIQSIVLAGVLIGFMCFAPAALAQNRSGAMSLSPSFGGYIFEGNQDLDQGLAYGLSIGYNFDKRWATEAAFSYIDTEYDSDGRNVDAYFYHLDGLYHFTPDRKLVPYVAAGMGSLIINPSRAESDHYFAINYGGGLKYFVHEEVALRADARHVVSFNDTQSNLLYTIGVTFLFGGQKARPAIVPAQAFAQEKVVIRAAEPQVEQKVRAAAAEPKSVILALEDVHFDFDQATLTPQAQAILKRNIQMLKANPNARIRVAGYTSASGTDAYNQDLSERRAEAVKAYLVNEGLITRDRLSTIGYGKRHPAMHEAAPEEIYSQEAKANMRVLFEILMQ